MKRKVWAEYDKEEKYFTGQISLKTRPIVAKPYDWYTWKKCWMSLTEIKKSGKSKTRHA